MKCTLKTVAIAAGFLVVSGMALAQTAQVVPTIPASPGTHMTPPIPAASNAAPVPALPVVPIAPIPLSDKAFLPDGQVLHLGAGETAHAFPRADGTIDHVLVEYKDGKERMRLYYKEGTTELLKGEEHRPDGTLKWKTTPAYGGPPGIIHYWRDGTSPYSITEPYPGGGKHVAYMRQGGHTWVLEKVFDAQGKQIEEAVSGGVGDNLQYLWADDDPGGLNVSYFFEDLGSLDFRQVWKSLPGTPEPLVTISWTDDNGVHVSYDLTLTSDATRAVKVVYKNGGSEVTDTVTADGKYIAARKVVDAKTGATTKDITFGNNKPRMFIPDSYFQAPPKPVDPASMGLSDPD